MSKTISDLRETLFAAIEGVRAGTLDLDRARAINEISKTIVDSARTEVEYLRVSGGGESEFIDTPRMPRLPDKPAANGVEAAVHQLGHRRGV